MSAAYTIEDNQIIVTSSSVVVPTFGDAVAVSYTITASTETTPPSDLNFSGTAPLGLLAGQRVWVKLFIKDFENYEFPAGTHIVASKAM